MLKIAYSQEYKYDVGENHRFPMIKYELLPQQLLYEGSISESNFFRPSVLTEEDILRVHTNDYWQALKNQTLTKKQIRPIGFPMSAALVERGRRIAHGTIECALFAQRYGVSLNVAGGTHHAYADHGEGFCVFNDFAIASKYLLANGHCKKILIVDLDVHQGNGTASIFRDDDSVFTFSMHGEKNYPSKKEKSDLDIGLPDKCDDKRFLNELYDALPAVIEKSQPDLLFYLSGVDILEGDKLGRLSVSKKGCKLRDEYVFKTAKANNIPVAVSMGGGYSERISDIIDAHANTFRSAIDVYF